MTINSISSRLGSIGPMARANCAKSIQRILDEDMPRLLIIAALAQSLLSEAEEWRSYNVGIALCDALEGLDYKDGPHAASTPS